MFIGARYGPSFSSFKDGYLKICLTNTMLHISQCHDESDDEALLADEEITREFSRLDYVKEDAFADLGSVLNALKLDEGPGI